MTKFTAQIIDPIGLHARPASELSRISNSFISEIKIIINGREANAKSIMNIMALGIKKNDKAKIEHIGKAKPINKFLYFFFICYFHLQLINQLILVLLIQV